ncbi:MAG: hypothetical protein GY765_21310 [bacterium]|nr:hypothetical protein [bacterium]
MTKKIESLIEKPGKRTGGLFKKKKPVCSECGKEVTSTYREVHAGSLDTEFAEWLCTECMPEDKRPSAETLKKVEALQQEGVERGFLIRDPGKNLKICSNCGDLYIILGDILKCLTCHRTVDSETFEKIHEGIEQGICKKDRI